ncbi:MAG: putative DNA-binding domain-containing protein [Oceanibaculum sp.]
MQHLPEQASFAAALLAPPPAAPLGLVVRTGLDPARRFAIHRNNMKAGLVAVLAARFPVLHRLVGRDFFARLALAFIECHPPLSPVLLAYGGAMPDFLAGFEPVRALPYLPDVARLEWLLHDGTLAADAAPLDRAALAAVAPEDMASLRFDLHPSLGLLASAFPVVTIWRANMEGRATEIVPADLAGEGALVIRPELVTSLHVIPPVLVEFAAQLRGGATLGEAAPVLGPDLATGLALLFREGAFTGFNRST